MTDWKRGPWKVCYRCKVCKGVLKSFQRHSNELCIHCGEADGYPVIFSKITRRRVYMHSDQWWAFWQHKHWEYKDTGEIL